MRILVVGAGAVGGLFGGQLAAHGRDVAFLARPVGSFVFMWVDRNYGRGTKLTIALVILGGSTASIAFLPGYDTIGYWAVALLALFRLGQGFALGGAWDGLASLLNLNAPHLSQLRRREPAERHQLNAREDRRQHAVGVIGHEHEHAVGGRLLQ